MLYCEHADQITAEEAVSRKSQSEKGYEGMRYLYLLLLVPLAACSYTTYLSDADERGGTVNLVTELTQGAALEKANEHCHQYNRIARVIATDPTSNTMTFACEEPSRP
jgi:hypothetical protein